MLTVCVDLNNNAYVSSSINVDMSDFFARDINVN